MRHLRGDAEVDREAIDIRMAVQTTEQSLNVDLRVKEALGDWHSVRCRLLRGVNQGHRRNPGRRLPSYGRPTSFTRVISVRQAGCVWYRRIPVSEPAVTYLFAVRSCCSPSSPKMKSSGAAWRARRLSTPVSTLSPSTTPPSHHQSHSPNNPSV